MGFFDYLFYKIYLFYRDRLSESRNLAGSASIILSVFFSMNIISFYNIIQLYLTGNIGTNNVVLIVIFLFSLAFFSISYIYVPSELLAENSEFTLS